MTPPDLLILCGGEGTRLGGIDKPLRALAGRRLIEHVLVRIAAQAGRVLISANRNVETYAEFGTVVDDGEFTGCGPLAGVAAGLAASTTDTLLCVPGDAPQLPTDIAARLDAAKSETSMPIASVFDGRGPQPLCCLVDRSLHGDLVDYLRGGGRTPREWFARHRCTMVDFSSTPAWAWSLNTAEEWAHAEQQLASH